MTGKVNMFGTEMQSGERLSRGLNLKINGNFVGACVFTRVKIHPGFTLCEQFWGKCEKRLKYSKFQEFFRKVSSNFPSLFSSKISSWQQPHVIQLHIANLNTFKSKAALKAHHMRRKASSGRKRSEKYILCISIQQKIRFTRNETLNLAIFFHSDPVEVFFYHNFEIYYETYTNTHAGRKERSAMKCQKAEPFSHISLRTVCCVSQTFQFHSHFHFSMLLERKKHNNVNKVFLIFGWMSFPFFSPFSLTLSLSSIVIKDFEI